jgi:hypothetical protein
MKTNHYLKLITLILLFIILGCQKEKDLNDEVLLSKEENFSITESSFIEALENKDFKNTYLKYEDLKSKTIKGQSSKIDPELYNFKIDGANVKAVKIGTVTSYTIPVYRDIVSKDYFENLVLQTNSSKEVKAFLIKYTHDGSVVLIPEHDSFTMQGTFKSTPLDLSKIKLTAGGCGGSYQAWCTYKGDHVAGQSCHDNNDDGRVFYKYIENECEFGDVPYMPTFGGSGGGLFLNSINDLTIGGGSIQITDPLIVPTLPDGTVVNFEEDMARSLASKLKITDQAQINYLIANFNVVLQLDDFLLANDTPEGREIVNKAINTLTNLDALKVEFENPNFDPINTPWLDRLRDAAKKIAELISNPKTPAFIKAILILNLDNNLSIALTATALDYNINAFRTEETFKQQTFNQSGKAGVGILLYEFANGTGPDTREFNYSGDMVARMFAGQVSEDLKADFLRILNDKNLSLEMFTKQGAIIESGYGFSPGHTTFSDSFGKHLRANDVQFFVGGANLKYFPAIENGYIIVELMNPTSRNSLLLHIGDNYERDGSNSGNNRPLSTIRQKFRFKLKIN